jgi:hypothetical protein
MLRQHEQILEIDPGPSQESREVMEEQCKPKRPAVLFCEQDLRRASVITTSFSSFS